MNKVSFKWLTLCSLMLFAITGLQAQQRVIKGTVISSEDMQPLPGVNVIIKSDGSGDTRGTITDFNGNYTVAADDENMILVFKYLGFKTQEILVGTRAQINVTLELDAEELEEVVVIGFGEQKKESVVGAITATTSKELQRAGGVTNLSSALNGLLPGVSTVSNSGAPGESDIDIFIRGQGTWNGAGPLILVNGIERSMNDIDVSEVESVSVLKDASATAVYGVRGANGVILVTTKRGTVSKPKLTVSGNTTIKTISRIPKPLGSYDALRMKNLAIEREIPTHSSWSQYTPVDILQKYRDQTDPYLYPDTDWQDWMTEDYALNYRANMNVSGGTEKVQYFASFAYLHEGDILKTTDYGQGYDPEFSYNRMNFRSNLDMKVTNSTKLSVDLAGYMGIQSKSDGTTADIYKGLTEFPPDYVIRYPNGMWGWDVNRDRYKNAVVFLNFGGYEVKKRTQLQSDVNLEQDLGKVIKGLKADVRVSYDTEIQTENEGVNIANVDKYNVFRGYRYEDGTENIIWANDSEDGRDPLNGFNYINDRNQYSYEQFTSNNKNKFKLYYQARINYARTFGKHEVSAMGLFAREENTVQALFPVKLEQWVSRATYNYDKRYFFEFNGAYNGSEKFGPEYKFDFFPSFALGWNISNEKFFEPVKEVMNHFKIRGSYGVVGSDKGIDKNLYRAVWDEEYNVRGQTNGLVFGQPNRQPSPYIRYTEGNPGNLDLHWEVAKKTNIGIETGFFGDLITLNTDIFFDRRTDIFVPAADIVAPIWNGGQNGPANLGETEVRGFEIELKVQKSFTPDLSAWMNANYTYSRDIIIKRADAPLLEEYRKQAGYQIGQTRTTLNDEIISNWDDMYTGVQGLANENNLPGMFRRIDYNADGVIDERDIVPYGYPNNRPQNTYNLATGLSYKGFSLMAQFYGVYNITRNINLSSFFQEATIVRERDLNRWTPTNTDADLAHLGFLNSASDGQANLVDASYIRLKTLEAAYTIQNSPFLDKLKISSAKIFVNGNNLYFWSNLPEDREGGSYERDNYPLVANYNIGFNLNF
ncbi:SusC/RagA family TonB-linked outer membrane protein [Sediminitomix flava]|uniref:TonB-linked SusC/RagA family outer membrane protein n=1 Tax=Sediminitomix flava TaxID=379075 RepID=A0A315Z0L3_SEDFL|nr:TonB-dependent receptor [Sediminitomix flava]PWJ35011.1 TonB-linked SusC/RagA family outer membrane protein [Sediminitomix flava]